MVMDESFARTPNHNPHSTLLHNHVIGGSAINCKPILKRKEKEIQYVKSRTTTYIITSNNIYHNPQSTIHNPPYLGSVCVMSCWCFNASYLVLSTDG